MSRNTLVSINTPSNIPTFENFGRPQSDSSFTNIWANQTAPTYPLSSSKFPVGPTGESGPAGGTGPTGTIGPIGPTGASGESASSPVVQMGWYYESKNAISLGNNDTYAINPSTTWTNNFTNNLFIGTSGDDWVFSVSGFYIIEISHSVSITINGGGTYGLSLQFNLNNTGFNELCSTRQIVDSPSTYVQNTPMSGRIVVNASVGTTIRLRIQSTTSNGDQFKINGISSSITKIS